jgi:hypothetical protein
MGLFMFNEFNKWFQKTIVMSPTLIINSSFYGRLTFFLLAFMCSRFYARGLIFLPPFQHQSTPNKNTHGASHLGRVGHLVWGQPRKKKHTPLDHLSPTSSLFHVFKKIWLYISACYMSVCHLWICLKRFHKNTDRNLVPCRLVCLSEEEIASLFGLKKHHPIGI